MIGKQKYPQMAGWKGNKTTGIQAAFAVSRDMGRRHAEVLAAFTAFGARGATCDTIGGSLDLPTYLVRPRASELESMGKLYSVGKAMGSMGHKVTVYSVEHPTDG
jgi:hypothetical protein